MNTARGEMKMTKTTAQPLAAQATPSRLPIGFSPRMVPGWMRMLTRWTESFRHGSDAEPVLRVEEQLTLGPKKMLFLVHCSGRQFLVATGADTIVSMVEIRPREKQRRSPAKEAGTA
jgi:hypothetical protein